MSRVSEVIMHLMLRERLLRRFEVRVATGETATIDVFLRKGTTYSVRGRIPEGRGTSVLSLRDVTGLTVPTHYSGKARHVYVTPERDGPYRIRATVKPATGDRESVTVSVTLSCAIPVPRYIRQIAPSSRGHTQSAA